MNRFFTDCFFISKDVKSTCKISKLNANKKNEKDCVKLYNKAQRFFSTLWIMFYIEIKRFKVLRKYIINNLINTCLRQHFSFKTNPLHCEVLRLFN